MNNFPPNRPRRPQQQNPNQFAPANVIMALVNQSRNRYEAVGEMLTKQDAGFRQLDLEANTIGQLMMQEGGQADPRLHALAASLQAAKRAGAIVRDHLREQLECEKFLQAELIRWLRGQRPIDMAAPQSGNAPPVTPPSQPQPQQLAQGQVPQQQQAPQQQQQAPQPPSIFTQTPFGPDPLAPQTHPAGQNAPAASMPQQHAAPPPFGFQQMNPNAQGGIPNHMFGPWPGQPLVPFAPAPPPESLPVTQLPVQQMPLDPNQQTAMPAPIQTQHYGSPEAARVAIPGPPPPPVAVPPVVQYASPEAAKNVIDASHANNVPVASVQQQTNGAPKPTAS